MFNFEQTKLILGQCKGRRVHYVNLGSHLECQSRWGATFSPGLSPS